MKTEPDLDRLPVEIGGTQIGVIEGKNLEKFLEEREFSVSIEIQQDSNGGKLLIKAEILHEPTVPKYFQYRGPRP